jgi:3-oxoacyl-[acyl-carrier-protein] synthase-3
VNAYINGSAVFLPNDPVTGEEIEHVLGMVGGKPSIARARVLRSNGIRTRYYAIDRATGRPTHTNAELTAEAIRSLFSRTGLCVESDMELLSCGTATPDQMMPSHGSMVHGELKSPPCEVFTASGACCASMAALKYAALAVAAGEVRTAVVAGSEVTSALMRASHFDPEIEERVRALEAEPHLAFEHDFLRFMLSDGAGSVLVEPEPIARGGFPSLRIEWIDYASFGGEMEPCMYHGAVKDGSGLVGWKNVADPRERVKRGFFNMGQDARFLNGHIGRLMAEGLRRSIDRHRLTADQISWILPHYSSFYFRGEFEKRIVELGLPVPPERHFTNLAEKGNTGCASIFIMLEELLNSGRAQPGQRILCFVPESARFSVAFMLLTVCDP